MIKNIKIAAALYTDFSKPGWQETNDAFIAGAKHFLIPGEKRLLPIPTLDQLGFSVITRGREGSDSIWAKDGCSIIVGWDVHAYYLPALNVMGRLRRGRKLEHLHELELYYYLSTGEALVTLKGSKNGVVYE